jgi:hypothetical protein
MDRVVKALKEEQDRSELARRLIVKGKAHLLKPEYKRIN